jgi:hypothetical protein
MIRRVRHTERALLNFKGGAAIAPAAILPVLTRDLKPTFQTKPKGISYKKIISAIYDAVLLGETIDPKLDHIFHSNKILFDIRHKNHFDKMQRMQAPALLREEKYFGTYIAAQVNLLYDSLCWHLKLSSQSDAKMLNNEFHLAKIGCKSFIADIGSTLKAYKLLKSQIVKIDCGEAIGKLPALNTLSDVLSAKEKYARDIYNLKSAISELERVMREEGTEKAIIKASSDITKAAASLSKKSSTNKIGKWTSVLSIPVGVAGFLIGGAPLTIGGLSLSVLGISTLFRYIQNKPPANPLSVGIF